jgi:CDP-4-dehydro-6-deoxyglucose reductase, E1
MESNSSYRNFPLATSTWGQEEIAAINRVVESGRFTMGEEVKLFESEFAEYIGSKYSVMFNSGSSANLALVAACLYRNNPLIRPGSTVLVPAVSWSTTFYPIHQLGLQLSFVDVDQDTLNIDVSKIEQAITPETSAIFGVNLLGNPADWESLRKIADSYNLTLIEDNCESMGASIDGVKTGNFGIGGTFSTFFSHHISTMEGGVVATSDLSLYETLLSVRAHGWTRELSENNSVFNKSGKAWEDLFRFVVPGYNLRPLEMEGAIGREQLKKLPLFIEQRIANARKLLMSRDLFDNIIFQSENGTSSWFGFSVILKGPLTGKREKLIEDLSHAGIESRPIVAGNFTRNPVMKHLRYVDLPPLPVADSIHDNGLFVGNHHYSILNEIDVLVEVLTNFEGKYT